MAFIQNKTNIILSILSKKSRVFYPKMKKKRRKTKLIG